MPLGYFTDSTPLTPLRDPFNVLVDGINAVEATVADARQIQTFAWANAAARGAQTGMQEGDQGYQADTDSRWTYNGSTWLPASGALPFFEANVTGTNNTTGTEATVTSYGTPVTGVATFTFSSGVLTLPYAGTWAIGSNGVLQGVNTNERFVRITKNGTSASLLSDRGAAGSTWGFEFSISGLFRFAANDTIRLRASQQTGSTLSLSQLGSDSPSLWARYIGL
jgi:hypothetical protein